MTEQNSEKILRGRVEKITYSNNETGFAVLKLKTDDDLISVVGVLPFIAQSDEVELCGEYVVHPSFGYQFKATSFTKLVPSDAASVLRYLSSGAIKGIGPATARALVERFGADSLDIIENSYERLAELRGISLKRAAEIHEEYLKQVSMRDVIMLLSRFKISPEESMKIYKSLGRNVGEIISQNPYELCGDGINLPFEKAETIAEYYNISKDSEFRLMSGIEYVLRANLSNGHTCLPENKLIKVAQNLLECAEEAVLGAYQILRDSFKIRVRYIDGRPFAFLCDYYNAESYIAARLKSIEENVEPLTVVSELEIDYAENLLKVRFDDLQRKAIKMAVETGVLVLTGGPGTGKTTILQAVIKIFERRNLAVMLAAPTGRAAKRMSQVTGFEAKTLHRLLECALDGNKTVFCKDESNPLDCDVLIVDEVSMVDALLFENMLRALKLNTRLILVGDADQLPSIGAGNILQDIIDSEVLPSVRLKRIFRQAKESKIVVNAHAIIEGEEIDYSRDGSGDFFVLEKNDNLSVMETVVSLCAERLPSAYLFSPFADIQVLCPSRKFELGTVNFNTILQNALNPKTLNTPELYSKGFYYHIGDKVMQTKNNYDVPVTADDSTQFSGVYNGDIGIIESINTVSRSMKVRFDSGVAEYLEEQLSELELAYAVTVHKSQGSEFDCVVIPLLDTPSMLCYRNLLYTAVTRAKKLLIIVGSKAVIEKMAENDRKTRRYTGLKSFIEDDSNEK